MRRTHHKITQPIVFVRAVIRQALHAMHHKIIYARNSKNSLIPEVKFWPSRPHPYSVVYRVFHLLGVKIKIGLANPSKGEIGFLWKDDTFVPQPLIDGLINGRCHDISKEKVETVHSRVFNYSLAIDPLVYTGKIVMKSNLNGAHDGIELDGPVMKKSNHNVYQLVVDNRPPDGRLDLVCDFRVPVFSGCPAFVYTKIRPKSIRFSNTNLSVSITPDTLEIFSPSEIERIQHFCDQFGLDYGEIDIVRDWSSKRIYILDVNKTPHGPPNGLSKSDNNLALELYVKSFYSWINAKISQ
jgi:hypothetical protein